MPRRSQPSRERMDAGLKIAGMTGVADTSKNIVDGALSVIQIITIHSQAPAGTAPKMENADARLMVVSVAMIIVEYDMIYDEWVCMNGSCKGIIYRIPAYECRAEE